MQQSIDTIYDIIKDYRNDDGIFITKEHIQEWALQFGDDAAFVLREFAHIVRQVYLSKNEGYQYLKAVLDFLQKEYNDRLRKKLESYLSLGNFVWFPVKGYYNGKEK